MKKVLSVIAVLTILIGASCENAAKESTSSPGEDNASPAITEASASLPLNTIKLPPGFKIAVYAEVDNARSMVMSPSGTLYVGNRNEDKVYAVKDTDGDFVADK
ncbi:MAG: sorbosone dehydrogenase family protein, partial [Cyclobacteriaceae bacterium]